MSRINKREKIFRGNAHEKLITCSKVKLLLIIKNE